MRTHVVNNFTHSFEQAPIVQHGLAHANPVLPKLTSLSDQARCMRQCAYRNRSIICSHPSKLIARDERRLRTGVRSAQCRNNAGGTTTYYKDVDHLS
jgi:hypothetical protein